MSNFAERLVARSAGTPAASGIAVLTPRPVSRFEGVSGIAVEAGGPEVLIDETGPSPGAANHPPPIAEARTVGESVDGDVVPRRGYPAEQSDATPEETPVPKPQVGPDDARQPHPPDDATHADLRAQGPVRSVERRMEQIRTVPAPGQPEAVPVDSHTPDSVPQVLRAATPLQEQHRTIFDLPVQSRSRDQAVRAPVRTQREAGLEAAPTPGPVISIGKIEVQFLPQEPRLPAPRPEPPRTRGFEAYARARRGEPR